MPPCRYFFRSPSPIKCYKQATITVTIHTRLNFQDPRSNPRPTYPEECH